MKNNIRVEWIGVAKGILIVCIICGHLNASKWFPELDGAIKWIYTFHMAVFCSFGSRFQCEKRC